MVACIKGPNRYFRNAGGGKFVDAGDELGLYQRIFNTRALSVVDLNRDGVPDLVLNNEGQESVVLLGAKPEQLADAASGASANERSHVDRSTIHALLSVCLPAELALAAGALPRRRKGPHGAPGALGL